ncbi:MAG: hypothetical protein ACLSVD_10255 [Eggerthellaceae bacterium]
MFKDVHNRCPATSWCSRRQKNNEALQRDLRTRSTSRRVWTSGPTRSTACVRRVGGGA